MSDYIDLEKDLFFLSSYINHHDILSRLIFMQEKQQLRKTLLSKRKVLKFEDVNTKSRIIQKRLEKDPWFENARHILFYISYGNEVQTHHLLQKMFSSKKQVIIPYTNTQTCTITPFIINQWADLKKGSYGILEPENHASKYHGDFDLIILPGVGFDVTGNRLGHGKGYYDRLINIHPKTSLIGLAYEFQILQRIPAESYDKKVGKIITEKRTIDCKKKT